MLLSTEINHKKYSFDSKEGIDLSIPYSSDYNQTNCFYAPFYQDEPVRMGDFVGSVALGGPVNFFNAKINIHGNGTHTECVGHITKEREPLLTVLQDSLFLAQLMTVYPTKRENGNDTALLSQLAGKRGRVLAFDIQKQALEHTKEH